MQDADADATSYAMLLRLPLHLQLKKLGGRTLGGDWCSRIGFVSEERNAVAEVQLQSLIGKGKREDIVVGVFNILRRHHERIGIIPVIMAADGSLYRCAAAKSKQTVARFFATGNPGPCAASELDGLAILNDGDFANITSKGK